MKWLEHLKTINRHRRLVREGCFRLGLYYQGLVHDLSKYSPSEFLVGAKYYQGYRSPNNAEREAKGYSAAWLHHKGRNRHHYEYWIDYSASEGEGMVPARMPARYLAEMYVDRVAACKIYNGDAYEEDMPLKYYLKGKEKILMEKETKRTLEMLLRMLARDGEEKTEEYIRRKILKKRFVPGFMKNCGKMKK
ncbi:MAG: DUF5662 family protein [Lachnospiraceae bacterium]|nr:DUF5662 family protein [Lachnospiraceae bacterium]